MKSRRLYQLLVLLGIGIILFALYIDYKYSSHPYFLGGHFPYLLLIFPNNVSTVSILDTSLTDDSFTFKTNFEISTSDLRLDITTNGMNEGNNCEIYLLERPDGLEVSKTWSIHNNNINKLQIEGNANSTMLELVGTCPLDDFIPKGQLDINIWNFTKDSLIIGKVKSTISFDSKKFGCDANCVYNEKLRIVDESIEYGDHIFHMEAENVDAFYLRTDLRTFDNEKVIKSNFITAMLVGLFFLAFQIAYDIGKDKWKN